jgi:glycosyltransferase involved in cell wall biosynthesis
VTRLVIGVPARNESERIVDLANRLEAGIDQLGPDHRAELALAYQASGDDTLERFVQRAARVPQHVLEAPPGSVGKGANVKLLARHALDSGADFLLLVDADLGCYDPDNIRRVVDAAERDGHALVLPLWARPRGQGNTTNYLASPLITATHRARIRQPIAGHMLLHRSLLERLDLERLPDDFGIDIMITLAALESCVRIGQVVLTAPDHPSKTGNSARVMSEVTTAVLRALTVLPAVDRPDVTLPDRYWYGWSWPHNGGVDPDHIDVIARHARSEADLRRWLALGEGSDDDVAEMWCDRLADAVRTVRAPHPDLERIVDDLVCPFFVHAEHRARRQTSVAELEQYVADLGLRLSARLHG